jgi:hypothetical protein
MSTQPSPQRMQVENPKKKRCREPTACTPCRSSARLRREGNNNVSQAQNLNTFEDLSCAEISKLESTISNNQIIQLQINSQLLKCKDNTFDFESLFTYSFTTLTNTHIELTICGKQYTTNIEGSYIKYALQQKVLKEIITAFNNPGFKSLGGVIFGIDALLKTSLFANVVRAHARIQKLQNKTDHDNNIDSLINDLNALFNSSSITVQKQQSTNNPMQVDVDAQHKNIYNALLPKFKGLDQHQKEIVDAYNKDLAALQATQNAKKTREQEQIAKSLCKIIEAKLDEFREDLGGFLDHEKTEPDQTQEDYIFLGVNAKNALNAINFFEDKVILKNNQGRFQTIVDQSPNHDVHTYLFSNYTPIQNQALQLVGCSPCGLVGPFDQMSVGNSIQPTQRTQRTQPKESITSSDTDFVYNILLAGGPDLLNKIYEDKADKADKVATAFTFLKKYFNNGQFDETYEALVIDYMEYEQTLPGASSGGASIKKTVPKKAAKSATKPPSKSKVVTKKATSVTKKAAASTKTATAPKKKAVTKKAETKKGTTTKKTSLAKEAPKKKTTTTKKTSATKEAPKKKAVTKKAANATTTKAVAKKKSTTTKTVKTVAKSAAKTTTTKSAAKSATTSPAKSATKSPAKSAAKTTTKAATSAPKKKPAAVKSTTTTTARRIC